MFPGDLVSDVQNSDKNKNVQLPFSLQHTQNDRKIHSFLLISNNVIKTDAIHATASY